MKRLRVGFSIAFTLLAVSALADPVRLTVGSALQDGSVFVTAVAPDSCSLFLQADAQSGESGSDIAQTLQSSVVDSNWYVGVDGDTLSFWHYDGFDWREVQNVNSPSESGGVSLYFSSYNIATQTDIEINSEAVGSGVDGGGNASFLTFSAAGTGAPLVLVLSAGATPESVVDALETYIERSKAPGLAVARLAPNKIRITSRYRSGFVSIQTNDTGFLGNISISDEPSPIRSGLIDR